MLSAHMYECDRWSFVQRNNENKWNTNDSHKQNPIERPCCLHAPRSVNVEITEETICGIKFPLSTLRAKFVTLMNFYILGPGYKRL